MGGGGWGEAREEKGEMQRGRNEDQGDDTGKREKRGGKGESRKREKEQGVRKREGEGK